MIFAAGYAAISSSWKIAAGVSVTSCALPVSNGLGFRGSDLGEVGKEKGEEGGTAQSPRKDSNSARLKGVPLELGFKCGDPAGFVSVFAH
jgi:hypothetical protein